MAGNRKRYDPAFKARVALEAMKEAKTIAELSSEFGIHASQIQLWKRQLLDGASGLFRDGQKTRESTAQRMQYEELLRQVGRLHMELEWVKKKTRFGSTGGAYHD